MRRMLLVWAVMAAAVVGGCGPSAPSTNPGAKPGVTPTQPTPPKGTKPMME